MPCSVRSRSPLSTTSGDEADLDVPDVTRFGPRGGGVGRSLRSHRQYQGESLRGSGRGQLGGLGRARRDQVGGVTGVLGRGRRWFSGIPCSDRSRSGSIDSLRGESLNLDSQSPSPPPPTRVTRRSRARTATPSSGVQQTPPPAAPPLTRGRGRGRGGRRSGGRRGGSSRGGLVLFPLPQIKRRRVGAGGDGEPLEDWDVGLPITLPLEYPLLLQEPLEDALLRFNLRQRAGAHRVESSMCLVHQRGLNTYLVQNGRK